MRTEPPPYDGCYHLVDREDGARIRETFAPSAAAIGPWSDDLQHGGPVGALLTRAMRRLPHQASGRITRTTVEILGPVAMAPVSVTATVERPGRRIALLSAVATQIGPTGEREVARATAWWLRTADSADVVHDVEPRLDPPTDEETARGQLGVPESWRRGFAGSLRWAVRTDIGRIGGPAIAWMSMPYPLVQGEHGDDLERFVALCDVANGVGSRLDPFAWAFMNTEMTVHLAAPPAGEWTGLVAQSWIGDDGIGLSQAVVHDLTRPVGRVAQSLLLDRR